MGDWPKLGMVGGNQLNFWSIDLRASGKREKVRPVFLRAIVGTISDSDSWHSLHLKLSGRRASILNGSSRLSFHGDGPIAPQPVLDVVTLEKLSWFQE